MFLPTHLPAKNALVACLSLLAMVLALLLLGSIILWFYLLATGGDVA